MAEDLDRRKIIGRFSTFLEHVKPSTGGIRVTRFNGLFHWAVPRGMEIRAGSEVGRHEILTHCYWREAGPEFGNVNIMAVAHGTEKQRLLEHKAAIDVTWLRVGYRSRTPTFFGAVGLRSSRRRYHRSHIANGFRNARLTRCSASISRTPRADGREFHREQSGGWSSGTKRSFARRPRRI